MEYKTLNCRVNVVMMLEFIQMPAQKLMGLLPSFTAVRIDLLNCVFDLISKSAQLRLVVQNIRAFQTRQDFNGKVVNCLFNGDN